MDIRNTEGWVFYTGPGGQTPTVKITIDGTSVTSLPASATTEIETGTYKTYLTAAQRNTDNLFGTITFPGYESFGFNIQLEDEAFAKNSDVQWIKNNMSFTKVSLPTSAPASGVAPDIVYTIENVGQLKALTFTVSSSGVAIANVDTWITTDSLGTKTEAGPLVLDADGRVRFELSRGTYYIWVDSPLVPQPSQFTI